MSDELPIRFQPCSNGEFEPRLRSRQDDRADEMYRRIVDDKAKRLGLSRRDFLDSACGMAAAVFVLNQAYGCSHSGTASVSDGGFVVPPDALEDQDRARMVVEGNETIFDVQVHNRVPKPPWNADVCARADAMLCPTEFIREIFVRSDTQVACLSGFPRVGQVDQPSIEARQKIKEIVDQLSGSARLMVHANVEPSRGAAELDAMERSTQLVPVAAWKTYPEARGLDTDDVGRPFIERARKLGIKVIAAHRGIGGQVDWMDRYSPRDVVAAAKASPDFKFLVYHAGWDSRFKELQPFDPMNASPSGVDRLVKGVVDAGTTNVYAELGSTWFNLMRSPVEAAHVLGKLLKHLGPDNILWGTDSVLNNAPQTQIAAFRAFQIPQSLQEQHGYPALTPEVKRKILGENGAAVYGVDLKAMRKKITDDELSKLKLAWREDRRSVPRSGPIPYGPRTRREYLAFRRWSGEG